MKKRAFFIGILLLFLTSCNNNSFLLPQKDIKEIVVTRVQDGETFHITNQDSINVFKNALTEVEKINGIVSILKQDYELTFYFEDDKQKPIFMWLSDQSGIAMDPTNEEVCYGLTEENVQALNSLEWH